MHHHLSKIKPSITQLSFPEALNIITRVRTSRFMVKLTRAQKKQLIRGEDPYEGQNTKTKTTRTTNVNKTASQKRKKLSSGKAMAMIADSPAQMQALLDKLQGKT